MRYARTVTVAATKTMSEDPQTKLKAIIENAWERRTSLDPQESHVRSAVESAIGLLDSGAARVAEPGPGVNGGGWVVNEWLKKAVLL